MVAHDFGFFGGSPVERKLPTIPISQSLQRWVYKILKRRYINIEAFQDQGLHRNHDLSGSSYESDPSCWGYRNYIALPTGIDT